jgi:signal transduction histidine kinase
VTRLGWGENGVMRRTSVVAGGLLAIAVVEAVCAAMAVTSVGIRYFAVPDSALTISNAVIGLALAGAGWPIAHHRPANAIGWLLLVGGVGYAFSAAGFAALVAIAPGDPSAFGWRLLATLTNGGWPWAVGVLLPLIMFLFPDGHLLSSRWRWPVVVTCVNGAVFVAVALLATQTLSDSTGIDAYFGWYVLDRQLGWLAPTVTVVGIVTYLTAAASLVVRYRRGTEAVRRQLLWILYGTGLMIVCSVVSTALDSDSLVVGILPVTLIPISIAIAIVKDRLLDIRLVISRSVIYLLLSVAVVAAYLGLVAWLGTVAQHTWLGTSVLATLLIAAAFHPARVWLQRRIDHWLFGARLDPVRAVAAVGERLGDDAAEPTRGLSGVLEALCRAMKLPSASIVVAGGVVASHGPPTEKQQSLALRLGSDPVGELVVGLRTDDRSLAPADERVLGLLTTSLAMAVHAAALAQELERARNTVVTARELERARLQRDLHDGLGPPLTAIVLEAAAAQRLVCSEPRRAAELMADVGMQASTTVDSVRRLVNELRPSTLEGLGLVGALRAYAAALTSRSDGAALCVRVEADPSMMLEPAVEVAAYRITTEALTNVARHSIASTATVSIRADDDVVTVAVRDDGANGATLWPAGIGLTSIYERARELGGRCEAGPDRTGGLVTVTIPMGTMS